MQTRILGVELNHYGIQESVQVDTGIRFNMTTTVHVHTDMHTIYMHKCLAQLCTLYLSSKITQHLI